MDKIRAAAGGMIGAMLGAAVWIAVGSIAETNSGALAVAVGTLAGLAVQRMCSYDYLSIPHGVIACLCALLAICGAKYFILANNLATAQKTIDAYEPNEEVLIACVAAGISDEIEEQGQTSERLRVVETEFPNRSQFAIPVWNTAFETFQQMSDVERQSFVAAARSHHAVALGYPAQLAVASASQTARAHYITAFSLSDLLWCAIALVAAFKLGTTERYPDAPDKSPSEAEILQRRVENAANFFGGNARELGAHAGEHDEQYNKVFQETRKAVAEAGKMLGNMTGNLPDDRS